jgi:hypothetical protein
VTHAEVMTNTVLVRKPEDHLGDKDVDGQIKWFERVGGCRVDNLAEDRKQWWLL